MVDLFNQLRSSGFPLGIEEYKLLLDALQAGYGFGGSEDLANLCCLLWVKSKDEEAIFRYHFERFLTRQATAPDDEIGRDKGETPETESLTPDDGEPPPVDVKGDRPPTTGPGGETRPVTPEETDHRPDRLPPGAGQFHTQKAEPVVAAMAQLNDEVGARLMQHPTTIPQMATTGHYRFGSEYLPISRRQMKQSWRYLRKSVREGPLVELDIEATIRRIADDGLFYEVVMVPRRINVASLVLLIDQEGSMVPFHSFSRRLVETAVKGGKLGQSDVYYFQNWPSPYVYRDSFFSDSLPAARLLNSLHPAQTSVLIFSDAGAARGHFSVDRVIETRRSITQLRRSVRRMAWLNPMPASRWSDTSAEAIAKMLPMFEISRRGLQDAIDVLRGRVRPGQRVSR